MIRVQGHSCTTYGIKNNERNSILLTVPLPASDYLAFQCRDSIFARGLYCSQRHMWSDLSEHRIFWSQKYESQHGGMPFTFLLPAIIIVGLTRTLQRGVRTGHIVSQLLIIKWSRRVFYRVAWVVAHNSSIQLHWDRRTAALAFHCL